MGLYLNPGKDAGKADQLIGLGADESAGPPASLTDVPEDKELICVVTNGAWDAALWVRDQLKFEICLDPSDPRPKRWLFMDKAYVEANAH